MQSGRCLLAPVRKAVAILVLAMASGCHSPSDATDPIGFQFVTHNCPPALTTANARCGYVAVPEDYSKRGGRTINLNVIVLNSLEPGSARAAQFDMEGGPGFAVTDSAAFYATDGAMYRTHRDVVLADMRGTGGSAGLFCPNIAQHEKENPGSPFYPPALIRDCAALLSAKADLRQYTTAAAARDVDAVRRALGYQRLDLNALSYGTTLALRYIADFPDHVRTAVLTGTAPASRMPPRYHAMAAERALKQLFDICAADPACSAKYPNPAADLERATERLDAESRDVFLEKIRTMLYLPGTARRVPSVLRKAAEGDFQVQAGDAGRSFADGLYLSITCSESLALMDLDAAIAESDATHFGAYRLRRQNEACRQWPKAAPDRRLLIQRREVAYSEATVSRFSSSQTRRLGTPVTPRDGPAGERFPYRQARHVIFDASESVAHMAIRRVKCLPNYLFRCAVVINIDDC